MPNGVETSALRGLPPPLLVHNCHLSTLSTLTLLTRYEQCYEHVRGASINSTTHPLSRSDLSPWSQLTSCQRGARVTSSACLMEGTWKRAPLPPPHLTPHPQAPGSPVMLLRALRTAPPTATFLIATTKCPAMCTLRYDSLLHILQVLPNNR